jgi:hypothetical protein
MSDRRDRNLRASISLRIRIINGENNGARPILAPLCLPSLLLFFPKIRVRDNEAGFRLRKSGHSSSHPCVALFLVQKLVEMIVSRTHLRVLDRIGYFRRQIIDPVDAALEGAKPRRPHSVGLMILSKKVWSTCLDIPTRYSPTSIQRCSHWERRYSPPCWYRLRTEVSAHEERLAQSVLDRATP